MKNPKISIVTVVWNDKVGLERTIQSIVNQTYENIEFIIIDGGSTDGTVDVIKANADKIDYWISEKDRGIYDAMNKGIQAATGTWVNFMNAGDTFVGDIVKTIPFYDFADKVLIYGNQMRDNQLIMPLNIQQLKVGTIMACHQSMFFNKAKILHELFYDLKYPIYGDYELVDRLYIKYEGLFQYINSTISDFEGGGISSKVSIQKRKDKYRALYQHYGILGFFRGVVYRGLEELKK